MSLDPGPPRAATLRELDTPALLLDDSRLTTNLDRMAARASDLGVGLRPHVKTAKSPPIAREATARHSGAITVSTLAEAEAFGAAGFEDIIYAVALAPGKLDRVLQLRDKGLDLKVLVDSPQAAKAVAKAIPGHAGPVPTLLEIDCDGTRGGLEPGGPGLQQLARVLAEGPGACLAGILTHAGAAYAADTPAKRLAAAEQERDAVVQAAERLTAAGHEAPIISVGSTPTALAAQDLSGVTEMRPGNYVFFDLFQAGLGVCTWDDIAVSVLTTVIGHRNGDKAPIVDAGALAMSKDRSTGRFDDERDLAYGLAIDPVTWRPLTEAPTVLVSPSQEHGLLEAPPGQDLGLAVGDRVAILPNHACITAACHDGYDMVSGDEVQAWYPRVQGW